MANTMQLPVGLLMLDFVGVLLLGLGLYEFSMQPAGSGLIPSAYQFDYYPVVMMVVGGALMIPFVVWIIKSRLAKTH